MADKQEGPGRKSSVTLSEAMGGSATPVNAPPPASAPVSPEAMDQSSLPPLKEEKRKWYNLGVLRGCPHQTVHVPVTRDLVVAFTLAAETVILHRETRTTERSKRRGDFIRLSDTELATLKERVKDRIVRWTSREFGRGMIIDTKAKGYVAGSSYSQEASDEPLGRYLFLKEVSADTVESVLNPMGAEGLALSLEK